MLNNKVKVSVVIPVYNVELYVGAAVLSIMNQSLKEIEIIIVNDGSTDNSFKIIAELLKKDDRIQIISNPNQGLSVARNLGIYRATGQYIYFFDSDDLLEQEALELCYNKCQIENLDFVFFDAKAFCEDPLALIEYSKFNYERSYKYDDVIYSGVDILSRQLTTNGYSSSACLSFINRFFLTDIQLDFHPHLLHEDELFTCLLYVNATRVGLINKVLFQRRLRKESIMTSSYTFKNVIGYVTVCRELHSYACRYATPLKVKSLVKKRVQDILLGLLVKSHEGLSKKEYKKVGHIVSYEFPKYIGWKIWLKLRTPTIFSYLMHIKYTFMNRNLIDKTK